jgi:hypothetical protein
MMRVTLITDHRAVDGAVAAAFLKTLREALENPVPKKIRVEKYRADASCRIALILTGRLCLLRLVF